MVFTSGGVGCMTAKQGVARPNLLLSIGEIEGSSLFSACAGTGLCCTNGWVGMATAGRIGLATTGAGGGADLVTNDGEADGSGFLPCPG